MDWTNLELAFRTAGRRLLASVAVRAAKRIAPVVARAADVYGPDALEWLNAVAASLAVTERFADGGAVSRFTLDLASDIARSAATAGANAARVLGPSKAGEDAELAFAAAAFTADVARASTPERAAGFAVQALRTAGVLGYIPQELIAADVAKLSETIDEFGPLWPGGEPDWSRDGWRRLAAAGPLPVVLRAAC